MPNYADDFARFLQAWPSQPDAVPALDDPLAIYPWARGLQPFLVPMSHQQSTPWFDPARQPNLVPLDVNPVAQAAPAPVESNSRESNSRESNSRPGAHEGPSAVHAASAAQRGPSSISPWCSWWDT